MASPLGSTSLLNILDDLEEPSTLQTTFCRQVTEQEYAETISSETDRALGELCLILDKNPEIYARILRKRRRDEVESRGVVSFMKSKVLGLVKGEEYTEKLVSDKECRRQTNVLKAGICKTFQYAQELNKEPVRSSHRIAAKRKMKSHTTTELSMHGAAPPPPPPLPPSLSDSIACNGIERELPHEKKKPEETSCDPTSSSSSLEDNENTTPRTCSSHDGEKDAGDENSRTEKIDTDRRLRNHKRSPSNGSASSPSDEGSVTNIHAELVSSNPIARLRVTSVARSPGGTPVRPKGSSRLPSEPLHKALVTAMRSKFKNVHTPSPQSCPSSTNNSSYNFTP